MIQLQGKPVNDIEKTNTIIDTSLISIIDQNINPLDIQKILHLDKKDICSIIEYMEELKIILCNTEKSSYTMLCNDLEELVSILKQAKLSFESSNLYLRYVEMLDVVNAYNSDNKHTEKSKPCKPSAFKAFIQNLFN